MYFDAQVPEEISGIKGYAYISLILLENGKLSSKMVVPIYNLSSSAWEFPVPSAEKLFEYIYKSTMSTQ